MACSRQHPRQQGARQKQPRWKLPRQVWEPLSCRRRLWLSARTWLRTALLTRDSRELDDARVTDSGYTESALVSVRRRWPSADGFKLRCLLVCSTTHTRHAAFLASLALRLWFSPSLISPAFAARCLKPGRQSQKSPLTTPEHGMSHAAPNIGSTVVEAFAGAAHVGAAPFTPRIAARLAEVVMDDTSTVGAKQSEHASVAAMPGWLASGLRRTSDSMTSVDAGIDPETERTREPAV